MNPKNPQAAGEGFVMVPREATEVMRVAGAQEINRHGTGTNRASWAWEAMLAAAPAIAPGGDFLDDVCWQSWRDRALVAEAALPVIDDAMVRRAVGAYDEWMGEHHPDQDDAWHDGMHEALTAALSGNVCSLCSDTGTVPAFEDDVYLGTEACPNGCRERLVTLPAPANAGAVDDAWRLNCIERERLNVSPLEGGGWDVTAFDCGDSHETLLASRATLRSAIDEAAALAPAAQQEGACPRCDAPTDPDCGHVGDCKPADPPAAVADESFVLVPKELPPEILAASAFAMGTGNPKHLWDFIINKLEARNG